MSDIATLVTILLSIIFGCLGIAGIVWMIGWWSTLRCRNEHTQEMFKLQETAKRNAIDIQERQQLMLESAEKKVRLPEWLAEMNPDVRSEFLAELRRRGLGE